MLFIEVRCDNLNDKRSLFNKTKDFELVTHKETIIDEL